MEQETARGEGTDFVQIWEGKGVPDPVVGFDRANLPCPVIVTYCREVL